MESARPHAHEQILVATRHLMLTLDARAKVVRFTRTAADLTANEVDAAIFQPLLGALAGIDRSQYGLLIDTRLAVMKDPAVASALQARGVEVRQGFRRTAVLVQTAVGALQIGRLQREVPGPAQLVFRDEAAALAWLGSDGT